MRERGSESGVVYVEFVMAFMPIFLLFLGIAQIAMLFSSRLLVHHATVRAARAAIVIADDDPRWYETNDQRGVLGGRHAVPDDLLAALARGRLWASSGELPRPDAAARPSRRSEVETTAALVLLPLAARPGDSLGAAIGSPGLREGARLTLERLEVALPGEQLGRDDPITVAVSYQFECTIPLARRLVCRDASGTRTMLDAVTLTNQGAGFEYDEDWEP
ncbi:MAG: pilus assembly protein [Sandaracinaceae bacterium]|nr:pilus assembly protein [Sandaracinaceae bacterium]